jgi:hypothetical protein
MYERHAQYLRNYIRFEKMQKSQGYIGSVRNNVNRWHYWSTTPLTTLDPAGIMQSSRYLFKNDPIRYKKLLEEILDLPGALDFGKFEQRHRFQKDPKALFNLDGLLDLPVEPEESPKHQAQIDLKIHAILTKENELSEAISKGWIQSRLGHWLVANGFSS